MMRSGSRVLGIAIAVALISVQAGCDDGPGFGSGLDDGTSGLSDCEADGDYPDDPHQWAMLNTVPPSVFDGQPKDLDLQSIYCQRDAIKSLIFILGAPG